MNTDIFDIFDINNDGNVSFNEFKKIWLNIGISRDDIELFDIFNMIDIDKNGTIEKDEFRKYINEKIEPNDIDNINDIFYMIETNEQLISFFELEQIISKLNIDISVSHLKTCFYNYTYDIHEKINMKQFMKLLIKSHTNISVFKIIVNLLDFIDQSETNMIIKNTTLLKKKELLNNYRWLKTISPFNLLRRSRIYKLLENVNYINIPYSNTVISYFDIVKYVFIIYYGTVCINKNNMDIAILNSGSILCLDNIINNRYYFYNAVVTSHNSVIWKIPIQDFQNILYSEKLFNNSIYNLSGLSKEIHLEHEINKNMVMKRIGHKSLDIFSNTRGFQRAMDHYPIKIKSEYYKLPNINIKKKQKRHNLLKNTKKSYSKLGKSLEKVYRY